MGVGDGNYYELEWFCIRVQSVTVSSEALMYLYDIDCKLMLKPLWASVVDPV